MADIEADKPPDGGTPSPTPPAPRSVETGSPETVSSDRDELRKLREALRELQGSYDASLLKAQELRDHNASLQRGIQGTSERIEALEAKLQEQEVAHTMALASAEEKHQKALAERDPAFADAARVKEVVGDMARAKNARVCSRLTKAKTCEQDAAEEAMFVSGRAQVSSMLSVESGHLEPKRQSEILLEGPDISDFWSENEHSDEEELNFAAEEEQLEARLSQGFSQQELDIPECEDAGQLADWDEAEHEEFVRLVQSIGQVGLMPVIKQAINTEADSGSSLGIKYRENRKDWNFNALLTLCTMDYKVFGELTHGNLVLAAQQDDELRESLDRYHERSKSQPSIYARVHVSRDGSAMSVKHAQRLVKWLRRYMSEDATVVGHDKCQLAIWRIDREFSKRWDRENTNAGSRRSLMSKSGQRSEDRVKVLQTFCDQLQARCEASAEGSLLSRPLLYIGYALRADHRQRQHEACGSSSNWLASLVQAACNVLWGRNAFRMHFFVVCLLSEEGQGPVAEMLLTRVTGAYYHGGSGFCIDIAGKSMESIHFRKLSHEEARDRWAEFDDWIQDHTPVQANWDTQAAVMAAKVEARKERKKKREEKRKRFVIPINEFLRTWALCQELKTRRPDWASDPQVKADVEFVDGYMRQLDRIAERNSAKEAAKEAAEEDETEM